MYYFRLDRPIRIILEAPPDPIVSTLDTPGPAKRGVAPQNSRRPEQGSPLTLYLCQIPREAMKCGND